MAKWSKMTYEMVAKTIGDSVQDRTDVEKAPFKGLAQRFCNEFKQDNPNFKPATFMKACGF